MIGRKDFDDERYRLVQRADLAVRQVQLNEGPKSQTDISFAQSPNYPPLSPLRVRHVVMDSYKRKHSAPESRCDICATNVRLRVSNCSSLA